MSGATGKVISGLLPAAETLGAQEDGEHGPVIGDGVPDSFTLASARNAPPANEVVYGSGSDVPAHFRNIWRRGLSTRADIELALDYIAYLDPSFSDIVDIIRGRISAGRLRIETDPSRGTGAAAELSFSGRVDRNSPDFGEVIRLGPGAGPDVLVHEIAHIIPLETLAGILKDDGIPEIPSPPHIGTIGSYEDIYRDVSENGRLHEVISFGLQSHFYDVEMRHGVVHSFGSRMMSRIYGAWRQAGFAGIRAMFTTYLAHYELKYGNIAAMLALMIKVEGRTDITWEEYNNVIKAAPGVTDVDKHFAVMERYLRSYAVAGGLDVPPDFFSMINVIRREDVHKINLFNLIRSNFESLAVFEELRQMRVAETAPAEISPEMVPPADSVTDRRALFSAYTAVVDRVLENPPPVFDRTQLASLISYVRMVPPQQALGLARRLNVYLTREREDLGVTLGLILYEKGLHDEGRRLIAAHLDLGILNEMWSTVLKVVGPEYFAEILEAEVEDYLKERREIIDEFRIASLDQFVFAGEEDKRRLFELMGYPETFEREGWHAFGLWLAENTDIDHLPEEEDLMADGLPAEFDDFQDTHFQLFDLIWDLRFSDEVSGAAKSAVLRIWDRLRAVRSGGYDALREVLEQGDGGSYMIGAMDDMGIYTRAETDEILSSFGKGMREAVASWGELRTDDWWSHPGYVLTLLESSIKAFSKGEESEGARVQWQSVVRFMIATMRKLKGSEVPPSDPLAKKFPLLIDRFLKVLPLTEELPEAELDVFELAAPFLPYFRGDSAMDDYHNYREALGYDDESSIPEVERDVYLARIEWITNALGLRCVDKAKLLRAGLKELSSIRRGIMHPTGIVPADGLIGFHLLPYAVALLVIANEAGEHETAEKIYDFIFNVIPRRRLEEGVFLSELPGYVQYRKQIEWALRLEMDRTRAKEPGGPDALVGRVRDEIGRGGAGINIGILSHFARKFSQAKDAARYEDVLRLMMTKSFLGLGIRERRSVVRETEDAVANVKETVQAIHTAPFPEEKRDELLHGYLEQLFGFISVLRGSDLSLVSKLDGLFTWRTPFMRAGDVPNYPRTEALILKRLAAIPELVGGRNGKDIGIRLSAFAAAGLPLQRYPEWQASLFDEPGTQLSLMDAASGAPFRGYIARYRLPHPYDIPQKLSPQEAEEFAAVHWPVIKGILDGEDDAARQVALKVLFRALGSDLRSGKRSSLNESPIAAAVLGWARPPFMPGVLRALFEAGSKDVARLHVARRLIEGVSDREQARDIFDIATSHLVFSKRVRNRIEELRRGGSRKAELEYYDLLLSIRYDMHPFHMASNFFLARYEESEQLRNEYADYLKTGISPNMIVIAETGAANSSSETAVADNWMRSNMIRRIEFMVAALRFFADYIGAAGVKDLSYISEGYIDFNRRYVHEDAVSVSEFGDILTDMGWGKRFEPILEEVEEQINYKNYESAAELMNGILRSVSEAIGEARRLALDMYAVYQRDLREEMELPKFIERYEGLKQDVLVWVMGALDPAQRNLLKQNLESASSDRERMLLLGRAAHFEKLLQLASIHPSVPDDLKELFQIFQEDVPPRDEIDAVRTLEMRLSSAEKAVLDVNFKRPIKEGTIGGIYPGTYKGSPIVLKLQPEGKYLDIMDSLRIAADIKQNLAASGFSGSGARAMDDLLGFYVRVMHDEMDLSKEMEKAKVFEKFLKNVSGDFVIPEYLDDLSSPQSIAMRPLYARRLKDLSPRERERVFAKIDSELIPAMMFHGVFHFDLHPGNIGATNEGKVVLYDVGRVVELTTEERGKLVAFYAAVGDARGSGSVSQLARALEELGTVRDRQAFEGIGKILGPLVTSADPFAAIEDIYPKLADAGFRLADPYVKLLLMHLTWKGTKELLRGPAAGGSAEGGSVPSPPTDNGEGAGGVTVTGLLSTSEGAPSSMSAGAVTYVQGRVPAMSLRTPIRSAATFMAPMMLAARPPMPSAFR